MMLTSIAVEAFSQELRVLHGNQLFLRTTDRYTLIKALDEHQHFYGYALLDSSKVFYAYQEQTGEAVATIELYDLKENLISVLASGLGGIGEAVFSYDTLTRLVIYNDYQGIHVFSPYEFPNFQPRLVFECLDCFLPMIIARDSISYTRINRGQSRTQVFKQVRLLGD